MSNTPDNVADLATEEQALEMNELALLGTMIDPEGPKALVRFAGGGVRKVQPGDRIGLGEVRAIGPGVVQISNLGGMKTLTMPQG